MAKIRIIQTVITLSVGIFVMFGGLSFSASPAHAETTRSYVSSNLLQAASFDSTNAWNAGAGTINRTSYKSGTNKVTALEGANFGATSTKKAGSSIAQTVTVNAKAGESYTATIWLRAASGTFNGRVVLWGLDSGSGQESASTSFAVGATWTRVTTTLSMAKPHNQLKLEIYEDTTGKDLYLDAAYLGALDGMAAKLSAFASAHPENSYGGQCVAFVKQYLLDVHGISAGAWGNAINYASGRGEAANQLRARGFTWHTDTNFQDGDILVWNYSPVGHVGIWYAYDGNRNVFDSNYNRDERVHHQTFSNSQYLGYWRK